MHLRHISPRSIDWMDAMEEGAGRTGWEKLGPEERVKLRHEVEYRGRGLEQSEEPTTLGRLHGIRGDDGRDSG
jgi:hypothetical protein